MTTIATFIYRGVKYSVSGHLWSSDGDQNGMIVTREDGRPIRSAKMLPGMIQVGLSSGLARHAELALQAEHDRTTETEDR